HVAPAALMVSLSKGLEQETLARVTEVLGAEIGPRDYGCLSGPSHATEVVAGLPVCLVVAGSARLCDRVVERLHAPRSRLYTSADLIGVEIGGALKNVVGIAAGICEGLGFGDNTKAAIITRGLAEMRRLGRAMGANDATFSGMAGVGDLMTTCYSPHGRNRALGLAIARGENPLEMLKRLHTVAEGAWTSRAAVELGRRHRVELPIASQVASVIWDAKPVPQAMEQLLARAPKEEDA
nr:NAD(P)H-dependent glycerol-3-phosphate dehydrogenase [Planctomycetota bacterium]